MITDPDLIAFAGDWHRNGSWGKQMIEYAAEKGAQAIIHAGDFGFNYSSNFMKVIRHALDTTGIHLYFVDGNHDDHGQLFNWPVDDDGFGWKPVGERGIKQLHYIPRGHRWQWHGQTYMGLGGAHSVDRPWRTPMVDWWPTELITTGDVYRALDGGKVNVMVTHDVPERCGVPNDRKSSGWPQAELDASLMNRLMLDQVVDVVQPDLLVHGHFHHRYEKQVGSMHVVGLDMDATSPNLNLWFMNPDLTEHVLPYEYDGIER